MLKKILYLSAELLVFLWSTLAKSRHKDKDLDPQLSINC